MTGNTVFLPGLGTGKGGGGDGARSVHSSRSSSRTESAARITRWGNRRDYVASNDANVNIPHSRGVHLEPEASFGVWMRHSTILLATSSRDLGTFLSFLVFSLLLSSFFFLDMVGVRGNYSVSGFSCWKLFWLLGLSDLRQKRRNWFLVLIFSLLLFIVTFLSRVEQYDEIPALRDGKIFIFPSSWTSLTSTSFNRESYRCFRDGK